MPALRQFTLTVFETAAPQIGTFMSLPAATWSRLPIAKRHNSLKVPCRAHIPQNWM